MLIWIPAWQNPDLTLQRSVTGTAHLPSLSHTKNRNVFCQYHFAYFSFVGRAGMDKGVACVCLHGSGIILMAELGHRLTGNKNNTAKLTRRGEPETAKVCGELGCREMEWEGLNPKLKCIPVCIETYQVVRCENHSGRWRIPFEWSQCCTGTGSSSVSSPLSSPSKYKKHPTEWAHQVHTWDSSYPLAL